MNYIYFSRDPNAHLQSDKTIFEETLLLPLPSLI
jgi:hypothetical protein